MPPQAVCPDTAAWQSLLAGKLPEVEQAELNRHLEACSACQRTVENLAAGSESWSELATLLPPTEQSQERALKRVVAGMKADVGAPSSGGAAEPVAEGFFFTGTGQS